MAIVVGISGKRGAGKDTLGSFLTYHKYKLMPFAGELKDRVRRDFNLSKEATDGKLKESPTKHTKTIGAGNTVDPLDQISYWTPREIMIAYGQFFRQFDSLYWVKKVFEKIDALPSNALVAITDVRFRNEAEFIRERGGYLVRLERKPELNIYKGVITDPSETELDDYKHFDLILPKENNETPQDLERFAERLVSYVTTNPREYKRT